MSEEKDVSAATTAAETPMELENQAIPSVPLTTTEQKDAPVGSLALASTQKPTDDVSFFKVVIKHPFQIVNCEKSYYNI